MHENLILVKLTISKEKFTIGSQYSQTSRNLTNYLKVYSEVYGFSKTIMLLEDLYAHIQLWDYRTNYTKDKLLISQMVTCHLLIVKDPKSPATFKTDYAEGWREVTLA